MNSILKSVLGTVLTIEEVTDKKETETTAPVVAKKNVYNSNSQNDFSAQDVQADFHPTLNFSAGDTQKYKEHFLQLLKESNMPGNDYYELNLSLDALATAIPDERTRYIAAYTPLSLNGLTREKVNSSAQAYLSTLDQDANSFTNTLEQKRTTEVGGKKQQIESNNKQIQELTAKIQQLSNENISINQGVLESEQKINSSKSGFEFELAAFKSKITNDLNKFNQYIQ